MLSFDLKKQPGTFVGIPIDRLIGCTFTGNARIFLHFCIDGSPAESNDLGCEQDIDSYERRRWEDGGEAV